MHPNPAYRQTPEAANLAFARDRGFGVLSVNGPDGPFAAHVPFVLADDGASAEMHLVRSNPLARVLDAPKPALLAISGPDGYISPDWYGLEHQVPTWNYIAVHLRGRLQVLPPAALRPHLDRLSAEFEARLAPKPAWLTDKMPDDLLDRLMRQIVPCRFSVETVDGTWKLGQNKPVAARLAAAETMRASAVGQEVSRLSDLMRDAET